MVVNKKIRYRTQRSNLSIHLHFPFAYFDLTNNMEKILEQDIQKLSKWNPAGVSQNLTQNRQFL